MTEKDQNNSKKPSREAIEDCIALLEILAEDSEAFVKLPEAQRLALLRAAGQLSRPNRDIDRKRQKAAKQAKRQAIVQQDRKARSVTGIRTAREDAIFKAPLQIGAGANHKGEKLNSPRN